MSDEPLIAVYAIAKNEGKNIEEFVNSTDWADYVVIADTGSTDDTPSLLMQFERNNRFCHFININPWRQEDARNAVLALLPPISNMLCLAIDLDERCIGPWHKLKEFIKNKTKPTDRFLYHYVHNNMSDGSPKIHFYADRFHTRFNYRWRFPCHETLQFTPPGLKLREELFTTLPECFTIQHKQDLTKDRGFYLEAMARSVFENPIEFWPNFYYARELLHNRYYDDAIQKFNDCLNLSVNINFPEVISECFCLKALAFLYKKEVIKAVENLIRAIEAYPERRKPYEELCKIYNENKLWDNLSRVATQAYNQSKPTNNFIDDLSYYQGQIENYIAVSSYHLGNIQAAKTWGEEALEIDPNNESYLKNMTFYQANKIIITNDLESAEEA